MWAAINKKPLPWSFPSWTFETLSLIFVLYNSTLVLSKVHLVWSHTTPGFLCTVYTRSLLRLSPYLTINTASYAILFPASSLKTDFSENFLKELQKSTFGCRLTNTAPSLHHNSNFLTTSIHYHIVIRHSRGEGKRCLPLFFWRGGDQLRCSLFNIPNWYIHWWHLKSIINMQETWFSSWII